MENAKWHQFVVDNRLYYGDLIKARNVGSLLKIVPTGAYNTSSKQVDELATKLLIAGGTFIEKVHR